MSSTDTGSRANDSSFANAAARCDTGTDAQESAAANMDPARNSNAGSDMTTTSDKGVVIDTGPGIDDGQIADLHISIDDGSSHDRNSTPQAGRGRNCSSGADCIHEVKTQGMNPRAHGETKLIVPERDKGMTNPLGKQGRQDIVIAENLHT